MDDFSLFHNDGGVHIEDEVDRLIKNDEKNIQTNGKKQITLQQVKSLISKPANLDNEVDDYVLKRLTFDMEHKVKRVNKYMDTFQKHWKDAAPMEMIIAFDECNGDIDELEINLDSDDFKESVKRILKKRLAHEYVGPAKKTDVYEDDDNEDDDDEDYDESIEFMSGNDEEEEYESRERPEHEVTHYKARKCAHTSDDETLKDVPKGMDKKTWASWSSARRKSYLRGQNFPNAYFYRHLPPGEKQVSGSWSPQEKRAFLRRLNEVRGGSSTMNGDWGLFSLAIPGRVGYQCANFYRKLIESGEVYDSNYIKGNDGSLHHLSRIHDGKIPEYEGKKHKHKAYILPSQIFSLTFFCGRKGCEIDSDSHNYRASNNKNTDHIEKNVDQQISRYDQWALKNPLPNMIDAITGEVIKVPTISPDGYVLDYNTWLNTLKSNRENPFTRAHVTKRQLVVLTTDNIHEYEDSIVNLNSDADHTNEN